MRRFVWHVEKAGKNEFDHGISFDLASEVFDDPNQVVMDNYLLKTKASSARRSSV